MRVLAWSDLHLENRSNFELIKHFCKLHHKQPASSRPGNCNNDASRMHCRYESVLRDSRDCQSPAYEPLEADRPPTREDSLSENIGKIWEALKGAASPVSQDFSQDVLILAGDIHYDLNGLKESLQLFCSVFGHVAFVPGNHELWVTLKDKESGIGNSVQKLDDILLLCDSLGVHTRAFSPCDGVRIVPLLSWYDEFDPQFCSVAMSSPRSVYSLPRSGRSVFAPSGHVVLPQYGTRGPYDSTALMNLSENWMDYSACKWPYPLSNNDPRGGGGRASQHSYDARQDSDIFLSGKPGSSLLRKSKQGSPKESSTTAATPPSIIVTPPTPIQGDSDDRLAVTISGEVGHAPSESKCDVWSLEKAREVSRALLTDGSRKTTDSLGMPLSLADFFAHENDRRNTASQVASVKVTKLSEPRSELTSQPASSSAGPNSSVRNKSQALKKTEGQVLQGEKASEDASSGATCKESPVVITFSHFLPRAELATMCPLRPSALAYVMGSSRIDEQLRQAGSSIHVFGHSHINADIQIEGVRYVQNSLGRTSEQRWFPERKKPKVIYETP